jgi:hypothetical protein
MDYEYTTPRKRTRCLAGCIVVLTRHTGQHLDEGYMDIDPPPRRPLHPTPSPFASIPPRGPARPSASSAPTSAFTFDSTSLPYEAFASAASPNKATSSAVVLRPLDDDDLARQLGATRVADEPAPASTARRRQKRQPSPKRKREARSRELDDVAQPMAMSAPSLPTEPSHHYSLHQHHYGVPERPVDASHWWREEVPYVLLGYAPLPGSA